MLIQPNVFIPPLSMGVAKYEESARTIARGAAVRGRKQTTHLRACIGMEASKGNGESYCVRVTVNKKKKEMRKKNVFGVCFV